MAPAPERPLWRQLLPQILVGVAALALIGGIVVTRSGGSDGPSSEMLSLMFDESLRAAGVDVTGGTGDVTGGDGSSEATGQADSGGDTSGNPISDEPLDVAGLALREEDLPSGWRAVEATENLVGVAGLCPAAGDPSDPPFVSDQAVYQRGDDGGPVVASVVGDHGRTPPAERWFASIRGALDACAESGTGTDLELSVESLDGIGDEAVAVQLSGEVDGARVAGDLFAVRVGTRTTLLLLLAPAGQHDPDLGRELVTKVVARL